MQQRRAAIAAAVAACMVVEEVVPLPGGASAAEAMPFGGLDGGTLMRRGMDAFRQGQVRDSVSLFDASADAGYPKALLWQRGLSLYYVDRFQDGAEQFRQDVELNPNDTEESIWAMLCEARTLGFEEAQRRMLVVGRDPRPVMRTVYTLFRGEDESKDMERLERAASNGSSSDQFYASLYLGLFAEAKGQADKARVWIERAASNPYARNSGDYMADLARVHLLVRGWATSPQAAA